MNYRVRTLILFLAITVTAACSQNSVIPTPTVTIPAGNTPTSAVIAPSPTSPTPTKPAPTVTTPAATAPAATIPDQFLAAQEGIANQYSVSIKLVVLVSYQAVEWRNSCLGVNRPGIACLDVITPGYELIFDTPHGAVEVHTNLDGTVYRILAPTSGIEGRVMVGPACPGPVNPDQNCPDQPYMGLLIITDEDGSTLAEVFTNPDGSFLTDLPPGKYMVTSFSGKPFPAGTPQEVVVKPNQVSQMQLLLDSGIR